MRALLAMIGGMAFLALLLGGTGGGQPSPFSTNPSPRKAETAASGSAWAQAPTESNQPRESAPEPGSSAPDMTPTAGSSTPAVQGTWGDGHPYPAEMPADALPPITGSTAQSSASANGAASAAPTQTGGWGAPMMDPKPSR